MIRDSLGLVSAALATQAEWKISRTSTGKWVLQKQALRPSEAEEPVDELLGESAKLYVIPAV